MSDSRYQTTSGHHAGLQVQTRERAYSFPWSQFLFAEGDSESLRLAFSTHDVNVAGARLNELLPMINAQRIDCLKAQYRAESFASVSGHLIAEISVKEAEVI
jgi:hypothetical protein